MEGVRATHPLWLIHRVEVDERGDDESFLEAGSFWSEEEARSECERLQGLQPDLTIRYEALTIEATVVHPADESPPWVPDPDRLRRRGYELPEPTDPQAS
jgi:hypothetical protein